jgi:peptide/nickel transport system permease protein
MKIVAALVTVQWAYYARTGSATGQKRREYIEAARGLGCRRRIVFGHLRPTACRR